MLRRVRHTFRSFAIINFRWFAGASLMVNTAMWMQRIAQDWLAVTATGKGETVGIVTALQFLPVLLISPFAGTLADRLPKRHVLTATSIVMGVSSIAIGIRAAEGAVSTPLLYMFALILGLASAADSPARFAYVRSFTDDKDLVNAIGLSALIFHSSRVIGPALAGLLMAATGVGGAFLAVGACHLVATLLLRGIRPEDRTGPGPGTGLKAAAIELGGRPEALILMALAMIVCAFSMNFQITITLMATRSFGLDAAEFGALTSMMAAGSIIGALTISNLSGLTSRSVFGAVAALGGCYLIAAFCPDALTFGLALVPIGFLSNVYLVGSNSLFQLKVPAAFQGRAMGLYQAASYALVPIGAALIGMAADLSNPRMTLRIAGVMGLLAAGAAWGMTRLIARRHAALSSIGPDHEARPETNGEDAPGGPLPTRTAQMRPAVGSTSLARNQST